MKLITTSLLVGVLSFKEPNRSLTLVHDLTGVEGQGGLGSTASLDSPQRSERSDGDENQGSAGNHNSVRGRK